jgi:hypothetical protein
VLLVRRRTPIVVSPPASPDDGVARLLLEIYRGALAVYPLGALGVGIACLNYADREWLLAAFNSFQPVMP